MTVSPEALRAGASAAADARVQGDTGVRPAAAVRAAVPYVLLLLPVALLVGSAALALPFAATERVALERLVGLALGGLAGLAVLGLLHRLPAPRVPVVLVGAALASVAGQLWVIAADPQVFRGPLGRVLRTLFAPLVGRVTLTEHIDVINTRFIVGYNGMADLCLVAIFAAAGAVLAGGRWWVRVAAAGVAVVSLLFLLGTGTRGGLAGLLVGGWLVAIALWRYGWTLGLASVPLGLGLGLTGVLDKGLEVSSTTGRLTYWSDIARLLGDFAFTGVGLGTDTANRATLAYEINPDPERIYYAHNTFVQTYLEQGPLGVAGMLLVPAVVLAAAWMARRGVSGARRGLLAAGLGTVIGLEVHGLTDQVLTSNVGTGLLLVAAAAVLACLAAPGGQRLARACGVAGGLLLGVVALVGVLAVLVPSVRSAAWLNVGSLQLNTALARPGDASVGQIDAAVRAFEASLAADPDNRAARRNLARARLARFDVAGALDAMQPLVTAPDLHPFDRLQVAHLYRDLGFRHEAYEWASGAYQAWSRPASPPVMREYLLAALPDDARVRTLVDQAESALRAWDYDGAIRLYRDALTFTPGNAYLLDRIGDAERAKQRDWD